MTLDSTTAAPAVAAAIRARRTSLVMDQDRAVPADLVAELVEAAAWAPCHKRTWPWRFAACTGEGRRRLGAVCGDALAAAGAEPARVDKARTKYLRAPLVLVVGSAPHDDPGLAAENRDATAAAIQNLLVTASAAGLASFWSSPYPEAAGAMAELCRFEAGTEPVGVIYLGWPAGEVPAPERPRPQVTVIDR